MVEITHTLVSVIIPIYNVERYLKKCLDSVENQTYHELEIILIDDGSTDNSPIICDKYAEKDPRITVLHKKNEGLSSARNAGLDIATGDYISFIDSDDWVSPHYIETLFSLAQHNKADIAIIENKLVYSDSCDNSDDKPPFTKCYTNLEALEDLFSKNLVSLTVSWGKLYSRNLFSHIRFPIGKIHEDEFTTFELFYNSKKLVYTNQCLYFYRQRTDSITQNPHFSDFLHARELQFSFFVEKKQEKIIPLVLTSLCWLQLRAFDFFTQKNNKGVAKKILANLRENTSRPAFKKIPYKHRVPLHFFAAAPLFYLAIQFSKKFLIFSKSK